MSTIQLDLSGHGIFRKGPGSRMNPLRPAFPEARRLIPSSCPHIPHGVCESCEEFIQYIGKGPAFTPKETPIYGTTHSD